MEGRREEKKWKREVGNTKMGKGKKTVRLRLEKRRNFNLSLKNPIKLSSLKYYTIGDLSETNGIPTWISERCSYSFMSEYCFTFKYP